MLRERVWTIVTPPATPRDTARDAGMSKATPITRKDVPAVTE
jgi:hypothetical protein